MGAQSPPTRRACYARTIARTSLDADGTGRAAVVDDLCSARGNLASSPDAAREWRAWLAAAAVLVRARRGVRHVPFPAAHAATRRRQAHWAFQKRVGIGGIILP